MDDKPQNRSFENNKNNKKVFFQKGILVLREKNLRKPHTGARTPRGKTRPLPGTYPTEARKMFEAKVFRIDERIAGSNATPPINLVTTFFYPFRPFSKIKNSPKIIASMSLENRFWLTGRPGRPQYVTSYVV